MPSRDEVIEAAMLARMVGSHLAGVDKMTIERSNNSANKISMQNFVAPLMGQPTQRNNFESSAPTDVMRAYEGLNELALRSVPDPLNQTQPPVNQQIHQIPQQNVQIEQLTTDTKYTMPIQTKQSTKTESIGIMTRGDVDSIRNSLKNIDKTLSNMLLFLTKKEVKNK